ncbi:MAG TPA: CAP domain-containing protein [Kofleriaceae bacterium]|nr:CAP domain-containing protein [Kofleriaceae bacterium]
MPRQGVVWIAALALALAAVAACSGGPRHVGQPPSWRRPPDPAHPARPPDPATIELVPSGPPAEAYNDPPMSPAPRSELGDAVTAATDELAGGMHVTPPIADGRLFDVAHDLAGVVPVEGIVPYALVEFTLHHHGIIEPSPHLLVVRSATADAGVLVEQLRPRIAEILATGEIARIGVGLADRGGEWAAVVALQASYVVTGAIPRRLGRDGTAEVTARIAGQFTEPEAFAAHDDGIVERLPLDSAPGGALRTTIRCGGRTGAQQIELAASDRTGSTVLANFPVWCDVEPPSRMSAPALATDDEPVTDVAAAEGRMRELVNRDRAAAGLPPVAADPALADVARAHSQEMARTGVVGHVSPTTGDASDRAARAGIHTGLLLENIARAYGVAEAEEGLMNSPGHRANVLAPGVTHVGIGIELGAEVGGRREIFVTQMYRRIPPPIDPVATLAAIRARLHGAGSFGDDPDLDAVAGAFAARLAAGVDPADASRRASADLDRLAARYARVASTVTAVAEVSALDPAAMLAGTTFTHVGVGVAQGDHPELGPGALHIVVLLAQAR